MQLELLTWVIDLNGMTEIARDAFLDNDLTVSNRVTKLAEWFMAGLAMADVLVAGPCSFSQFDVRNILLAGKMSVSRVPPFIIMPFVTLLAAFSRFQCGFGLVFRWRWWS